MRHGPLDVRRAAQIPIPAARHDHLRFRIDDNTRPARGASTKLRLRRHTHVNPNDVSVPSHGAAFKGHAYATDRL